MTDDIDAEIRRAIDAGEFDPAPETLAAFRVVPGVPLTAERLREIALIKLPKVRRPRGRPPKAGAALASPAGPPLRLQRLALSLYPPNVRLDIDLPLARMAAASARHDFTENCIIKAVQALGATATARAIGAVAGFDERTIYRHRRVKKNK